MSQNIRYSYSSQYLMGESAKLYPRSKKNKLQFISLKISNRDTLPIVINKNTFEVFGNYKPVKQLSTMSCFYRLSNNYINYIPFLMVGTLVSFRYRTLKDENTDEKYGSSIDYEPGFASGSVYGLAGVAIIAASSANSKIFKNLEASLLYGDTIKPGQTKTGFICYKAVKAGDVHVRLRK